MGVGESVYEGILRERKEGRKEGRKGDISRVFPVVGSGAFFLGQLRHLFPCYSRTIVL